jgi:hypothetical protein
MVSVAATVISRFGTVRTMSRSGREPEMPSLVIMTARIFCRAYKQKAISVGKKALVATSL